MSTTTRLILGALCWGALLVLVLTGCAAPQSELAAMTAEQIKAASADRSASATCSTMTTTLTTARVTHVMLDRGVGFDAEVVVDSSCSVTMRSLGKR
jgi:hypothetical protein